MAGHALTEALAQAGRGPDEVCLLTASVGGELGCTFANLTLLIGDPPSSSPLRFGNSVHNAALGHLAISAGNRHTASAIAVNRAQVAAMGVLEAAAHVLDLGTDAAVVFVEETWPGADFAPSAVAVVLSADGGFGTLSDLSPTAGPPPARGLPANLEHSPTAASLQLLDGLLGPAAHLGLAHGTRPWSARWSPA